jgi:hypothetical protein
LGLSEDHEQIAEQIKESAAQDQDTSLVAQSSDRLSGKGDDADADTQTLSFLNLSQSIDDATASNVEENKTLDSNSSNNGEDEDHSDDEGPSTESQLSNQLLTAEDPAIDKRFQIHRPLRLVQHIDF